MITNLEANITNTHGVSKVRLSQLAAFRLYLQHLEKRNWFATAEILLASKQTWLAQTVKKDNRINPTGTPAWTIFDIYSGINIKRHTGKIGF